MEHMYTGDHYPCTLEHQQNSPCHTKEYAYTLHKWNIKDTNWEHFTNTFDNLIKNKTHNKKDSGTL